MKKLNITKEQFEKSKYFNNKYGKLEYVSESGKVFKTEKGKILMFKESASKGFEKFCEELKTKFSNIDGVRIYLMDNEDGSNTITVSIRRFDDARSVWYPEDVKKIGQFIKRKCDRFGWTVEKNVEYRLGITDFYITEIESTKDSSDEVVKESSNTKDEPYSVYKFINTLRCYYNEYMLEEPSILGGPGEGWKEISIMCSKSQHRKMLGVVKEYCQKYGWEYQSHKIDDDVYEIVVSQREEFTLTDDYLESTKKFGRKFNESDELASILANLIRQASPESQERIMRMLERDADGTDAGKSAGERVRDSYRDDL